MSEVSAYDAKTHFSEYLARAKDGEEFVITHRGKPVAKLVPLRATHDRAAAQAAFDRMRSRAKQIEPPITLDEIKSWIDEGRE